MKEEIMKAIEKHDNYAITHDTKKFVFFVRDFIKLSKKEFKEKFPTLKYKKIKEYLYSEKDNPFYKKDTDCPYEYLQSKIENEGEGYFILHYTDGLSESPTLKSFLKFQKAAVALEDYLNFVEKKYKEEQEEIFDDF